MASYQDMGDGSVKINGLRYPKGSEEAVKAFEAEQRAEQAQAAVAQQRREADEAAAHTAFVGAGGTEEQWAKEKGAILADRRRVAVASGQTAADLARTGMADRFRNP